MSPDECAMGWWFRQNIEAGIGGTLAVKVSPVRIGSGTRGFRIQKRTKRGTP
jgi:hypothetical protein